jgi:hypothetical protein
VLAQRGAVSPVGSRAKRKEMPERSRRREHRMKREEIVSGVKGKMIFLSLFSTENY